jgi:transcription elongation factor GreA
MKTQITKEGFEKLQKELEEFKTVKRPLAVQKLATARSMGDLSENSAYTAAKQELNFIDGKIRFLEKVIRFSHVVSPKISGSEVVLGSFVRIKNKDTESQFHIVGKHEADPMNGKLSIESPIGKALMGKKIREEIEIEVPSGKVKYKIISVS